MRTNRPHLPRPACLRLLLCLILVLPPSIRAAELTPSDGVASGFLATSTGLSGGAGLVGGGASDNFIGMAYFFRNLDTVSGTVTESLKLAAADRGESDFFGESASLSGNAGLVGAHGKSKGKGAAYLFRNLDTASGTVTENVRLTASDNAEPDAFGVSVSLFGNVGIVGAYSKINDQGAAYLFRNLDTASGTVTENARLAPSSGAAGDYFGLKVSLSGNTGLVGAGGKDNGKGAAYLFRNLDTASGTVTENVRLAVSTGAAGDFFGLNVSLSGNTGLVGAGGKDNERGAAYLFRSLDTVSGTVTENVQLTASDGTEYDNFGGFVSLSGNAALVGAYRKDNFKGAAYLFRNLDSASGTITENVQLTASGGVDNDNFGSSITLDDDRFLIGADGKAYSGRVSAFTTLDEGGASRATDRLSFVSRDHWVIGQNTDGNQLTLSAGDSGSVIADGKTVSVGGNAGSDRNVLTINGSLTANSVQVGAAGNTGNALRVGAGGTVTTTGGVMVAAGSSAGGDGTINGDLRFSAASSLAFAAAQTLTVNGKVSFDGSFGAGSLPGLSSATPDGTYTLIDSTATNFAALGLSNWGAANAYNLGGRKSAWLSQQNGSLQVVVGTGVMNPELPVLTLNQTGGQLTLAWTTPLSGLILETSPNLLSLWKTVEQAPLKNGDNHTLTLLLSGERAFYRLRKP